MLKQQTSDLLKIKTLEITTRLNQYHKEKKTEKICFDIKFYSNLFTHSWNLSIYWSSAHQKEM